VRLIDGRTYRDFILVINLRRRPSIGESWRRGGSDGAVQRLAHWRALAVRDNGSYDLPFVLTYPRAALTALGDPSRQAIFERLLEQPSAVVDLARALPLSRPAVSQHLKILKTAGLVAVEPQGTRRIYRADPDGISVLRDDLQVFWSRRSWASNAG
jgi:DNA-binding transcriptional ArsR family regulator